MSGQVNAGVRVTKGSVLIAFTVCALDSVFNQIASLAVGAWRARLIVVAASLVLKTREARASSGPIDYHRSGYSARIMKARGGTYSMRADTTRWATRWRRWCCPFVVPISDSKSTLKSAFLPSVVSTIR